VAFGVMLNRMLVAVTATPKVCDQSPLVPFVQPPTDPGTMAVKPPADPTDKQIMFPGVHDHEPLVIRRTGSHVVLVEATQTAGIVVDELPSASVSTPLELM